MAERPREVVRRRANRRGQKAEFVAAVVLVLHGHVILDRRYKTPLGEIDIIARRGRRLAFVEVKQRPTQALCEAALSPETRRRVRRSAGLWMARHPHLQSYEMGFDVIFAVPWRWPVLLRNAL